MGGLGGDYNNKDGVRFFPVVALSLGVARGSLSGGAGMPNGLRLRQHPSSRPTLPHQAALPHLHYLGTGNFPSHQPPECPGTPDRTR